MQKQLKLDAVVDFEEFLITEKVAQVALETARNLADRPDDKPTVTYIKNGPRRIIHWVKNMEKQWVRRESITHDSYWAPTELVEFHDLRQANREALPEDRSVSQGTEHPKTPKFPSDKSISVECKVGDHKRLLAFEIKNKEAQPFWKTLTWLMEQTNLSRNRCIRLRDAFTALSFDRKCILGIIDDIDKQYVSYLEALVEDLPIPPPIHYDPELYSDHGIIDTDSLIATISEETLGASLPQESIRKLRTLIEPEFETEEEKEETPAQVFGLRKLYYEEDGCSHEFLSFLRFATVSEIKGVMRSLFPQKNSKGYLIRARFWYLTASQRSQAWTYINCRREELGMISEESQDLDFTADKGGK